MPLCLPCLSREPVLPVAHLLLPIDAAVDILCTEPPLLLPLRPLLLLLRLLKPAEYVSSSPWLLPSSCPAAASAALMRPLPSQPICSSMLLSCCDISCSCCCPCSWSKPDRCSSPCTSSTRSSVSNECLYRNNRLLVGNNLLGRQQTPMRNSHVPRQYMMQLQDIATTSAVTHAGGVYVATDACWTGASDS